MGWALLLEIGDWGTKEDFTAPNRERIGRMSRRLILTTIWVSDLGVDQDVQA